MKYSILQHFRTRHARMVALWLLRILSPAVARRNFVQPCRSGGCAYQDADIAVYLGLPEDPDILGIDGLAVVLDSMRDKLEKAVFSDKRRTPVHPALQSFGEAAGLSEVDRLILEFLACRVIESGLSDACSIATGAFQKSAAGFFSKVLDIPLAAATKAIGKGGQLRRLGLIQPANGISNYVAFDRYNDTLAWSLLHEAYDPNRLLKNFGVTIPAAADLDLEDFPHLEKPLRLLMPYLAESIRRREVGVNIVLHGPAGTGKTQLTRVLARHLGVQIYELDTADEDGDPRSPAERFSGLRIAQQFVSQTAGLLVFDEAEDILAGSMLQRGAASACKGWFNGQLETNPLPIIWIANSISELDPAAARRFDMILQMPVPSRTHRLRILRDGIGQLASPALIDRFSESRSLAPAVVARAAKVIRRIGPNLPEAERDGAIALVLNETLRAQGYQELKDDGSPALDPAVYDISFLNTRADLAGIASRLATSPSARLCLHGPPGTGKSAFGHWLAREIDRPIHVKRASDLLGSYVGQTERQIAASFSEAREDNAILMLDEIDSFLLDRSSAHRSWEITQVNEMLTQIEAYPGILIASTNRLRHLDPASLRRFDLKLEFGNLRTDQAARLLASHCDVLALTPATPADLARLATLDNLTPGDFAAVSRRHRFSPLGTAACFVAELATECDLKTDQVRRIGFAG